MFQILVGTVSIIVTVISIIVTMISICQNARKEKHQKSNHTDQS